jgi:sec-independent protein translocase protein TatB
MMLQSVSLAFLGGAVGPGELLLVFVVVLLLFGPRRLPEIAKTLGKMASEMRKASRDFQDQVMKIEEELPKAEFSSMLADEPAPAALPPASPIDVDGVPVTDAAASAVILSEPDSGSAIHPLATAPEAITEAGVPVVSPDAGAQPDPAVATQTEFALEPVKPGVTCQPGGAEAPPAND